jgi:hypothetical protein
MVLCASWLTAGTGAAVADEVAMKAREPLRAEMPRGKGHRTGAWSAAALPAAWSTDLVPTAWQRPTTTQLHRPADWLIEERSMVSTSGFDTSSLFRTRKEMKYRDTLRLLLTKRQLRVWLRDDLHMQCEIKRYRSLDDGREVGLKLGMYYRFQ